MGSLGDEDDAQTLNMRITWARVEKARDTTLDDEKQNWPGRRAVRVDRTCVVVMVL